MLKELQKLLPKFAFYKVPNALCVDRYDEEKKKTFRMYVSDHKEVGVVAYTKNIILKTWEDRNA